MDSHIFAGHARARHVMRMNYCGFSAVNASISVVRRADVQSAAPKDKLRSLSERNAANRMVYPDRYCSSWLFRHYWRRRLFWGRQMGGGTPIEEVRYISYGARGVIPRIIR
jgi:hypothetical protein